MGQCFGSFSTPSANTTSASNTSISHIPNKKSEPAHELQSSLPSEPAHKLQSSLPSEPAHKLQSSLPSEPAHKLQSSLPSEPAHELQSSLPSEPAHELQPSLPSEPSSQPNHNGTNLDVLKENWPLFDLNGQVCPAYCVSVYDGDTITLNILTSYGYHKWKVRLSGFDAPELKTKNILEKKHGLACREMMRELVLHKYCMIRCGKFEKYGRLLGEVFLCPQTPFTPVQDTSTWLSLNQWMLQNTPCIPYDGKTKSTIEYHLDRYNPKYLLHVKP